MDNQKHDTEIIGDFVRVASCATPTEAYIIKGALQAAGLSPTVADANIVQANSWMTQAVGGVRLLVPASQVEAARRVITDFHAGTYQLEGEDSVPVEQFAQLPAPIFSPDRAAVLSFAFTPAFGVAIQLANLSTLGLASSRLRYWGWLVSLTAISFVAIAVVHRISPGPLLFFRASFSMSFITAVWYFLSGKSQSQYILSTYGSKYRKRSMAIIAMPVATAQLLVGWAISEFV